MLDEHFVFNNQFLVNLSDQFRETCRMAKNMNINFNLFNIIDGGATLHCYKFITKHFHSNSAHEQNDFRAHQMEPLSTQTIVILIIMFHVSILSLLYYQYLF